MAEVQRAFALVLLIGSLTLAACSPEATRARSGGPGADQGNRGADVDMHGQRNPAFRVPARNPGLLAG